jgi:hypothetical protein
MYWKYRVLSAVFFLKAVKRGVRRKRYRMRAIQRIASFYPLQAVILHLICPFWRVPMGAKKLRERFGSDVACTLLTY